MIAGDSSYWSGVGAEWLATARQRLWRVHHDAVVGAWLVRWLAPRLPCRMLKTDLFEEATANGLVGLIAGSGSSLVGIDVAAPLLRAAVRHPEVTAVHADVRRLPFADASFDCVVSTSTLDHFASLAELEGSLRELVRVLRPSGQLLLTLDNLSNPVVWLRNRLPGKALRRLGLVPYRLGVSTSAPLLRRLLEEVGTTVTEMTAILHCPRVLAVPAARLADRLPSAAPGRVLLRLLEGWEVAGRWPTRLHTGHYLAVRAVRA